MAIIYNSDLTKELVNGAKLQISRDKIPNEIAEKVVPVMEVNPNLLRNINIVESTSRTTSGTSTIYTTPTNKNFFLCGIFLGGMADAAADSTSFTLSGTIKGGASGATLLSIPKLSLTAINFNQYVRFSYPILMQPNTAISITQTFAVGNSTIRGIVYGYVEDTTNA